MARRKAYYHVQVIPKSDPDKIEVVLDLSLEDLQRQFIVPYGQGRAIVINGKTVPLDELDRIRINETNGDSRQVASDLEGYELEMGYIHPSDEVSYSSLTLARQGEDVTNKYITAAPAQAPEAQEQPRDEIRPAVNVQEVFVVHGRNAKARDAMFTFLRSIGLKPLEWNVAREDTGKPLPYIGDILKAAFSRAHAVVVLLTPDDEVRLKKEFQLISDPPHETQLTGQARPNVLFEAGMAMGSNENRVVLVELGNLRPFTDIAGLHIVRMDNSSPRRQELAQRLRTAGCPINLDGEDWHTAGEFDLAVAEEPSVAAQVEGATDGAAARTELSDDAKDLLLAAANKDDRMFVVLRGGDGIAIRAGSTTFVDTDNQAEIAKWEAEINSLLVAGLIQRYAGGGEAFEVTHHGYLVAFSLGKQLD